MFRAGGLGVAFVLATAVAQAATPLGHEAANHIASRDWECVVSQPTVHVKSNELKSLSIFRVRKIDQSPSHFRGTGSIIVHIDSKKYTADYVVEGYTFDDKYDGTGLYILKSKLTRGDRLPSPLYFQDDGHIKLTAVPNGSRMPVRLVGTHDGAQYDCR